jgi:hypothetical protein
LLTRLCNCAAGERAIWGYPDRTKRVKPVVA